MNSSYKGKMEKKVTPDNVYLDNTGHIYFTIMEVNIIGAIDVERGEVRYFSGPNQERSVVSSLYGGICRWRDYLILAPYNASKIWLFQVITKEWQGIDINVDPSMKNRNGEWFSGIELIDDDVYFLGYGYSCILKLDMNSFETEVFVQFDKIGLKGMKLWAKSYVRRNKELYIAVNDSNIVMKIDCKQKKVNLIELGNSKNFAGITAGDDEFWVISYLSNELIQWNEEKDFTKVLILPKKIDVWGAEFVLGKLLLYHPQYNMISYDTKNEDFDECNYIVTNIKRISDQKVCLSGLGLLRIVNNKTPQEDSLQFNICISDDEIKDMLVDNSITKVGMIKETNVFGLGDFLEAI